MSSLSRPTGQPALTSASPSWCLPGCAELWSLAPPGGSDIPAEDGASELPAWYSLKTGSETPPQPPFPPGATLPQSLPPAWTDMFFVQHLPTLHERNVTKKKHPGKETVTRRSYRALWSHWSGDVGLSICNVTEASPRCHIEWIKPNYRIVCMARFNLFSIKCRSTSRTIYREG